MSCARELSLELVPPPVNFRGHAGTALGVEASEAADILNPDIIGLKTLAFHSCQQIALCEVVSTLPASTSQEPSAAEPQQPSPQKVRTQTTATSISSTYAARRVFAASIVLDGHF